VSNNPYKVLGVSQNASDDDIKKAYHELVRKYHPDRYAGSDLADLAGEKMKEINAAYEQIQRERAEAASGSNTGTGSANYGQNPHNGGGNSYSSHYSESARSKFVLIRNCINAGNITEAERLLNEISDADRGAEWYFLCGCVALRKGFYADAQRHFDTAYRMEPTNNEYWTFKTRLNSRAQNFGGGYQQTTSGGGCSGCDMCSSLLCADCCCECMGGDLISCC